MPDNSLPPIPPGFTLDPDTSPVLPPIPHGFELDKPQTQNLSQNLSQNYWNSLVSNPVNASIEPSPLGGPENTSGNITALGEIVKGIPVAGNYITTTPAMKSAEKSYPGLTRGLRTIGTVVGSLPEFAAGTALAGPVAGSIIAGGGIGAADVATKQYHNTGTVNPLDVGVGAGVGAGLGAAGAALPVAAPYVKSAVGKAIKIPAVQAGIATAIKGGLKYMGVPDWFTEPIGDFALARILKQWDNSMEEAMEKGIKATPNEEGGYTLTPSQPGTKIQQNVANATKRGMDPNEMARRGVAGPWQASTPKPTFTPFESYTPPVTNYTATPLKEYMPQKYTATPLSEYKPPASNEPPGMMSTPAPRPSIPQARSPIPGAQEAQNTLRNIERGPVTEDQMDAIRRAMGLPPRNGGSPGGNGS